MRGREVPLKNLIAVPLLEEHKLVFDLGVLVKAVADAARLRPRRRRDRLAHSNKRVALVWIGPYPSDDDYHLASSIVGMLKTSSAGNLQAHWVWPSTEGKRSRLKRGHAHCQGQTAPDQQPKSSLRYRGGLGAHHGHDLALEVRARIAPQDLSHVRGSHVPDPQPGAVSPIRVADKRRWQLIARPLGLPRERRIWHRERIEIDVHSSRRESA